MNRLVEPAATILILLVAFLINCRVTAEEKTNPFSSLQESPPDKPSASSPSFSPDSSSPVFPVFTKVLNAFPPSGVDGSHVSVILDEDRIEGVGYGEVLEKETMMRAVEDFVIEFKNPTTGVVVDYGTAEYGYIEGKVEVEEEVVVIVRRSQKDPLKPAHDIRRFPAGGVSSDISRVFLYNAVWSNNTDLPGMNFYKVNRKTGRLIELTTGLQMGEGVEITLSPGKSTTIKASHADLKVSHDPKLAQTTEIELLTVPGRRQYAVFLGDQTSGETRAVVMRPTAGPLSGGSPTTSHNALLLNLLLTVALKQHH